MRERGSGRALRRCNRWRSTSPFGSGPAGFNSTTPHAERSPEGLEGVGQLGTAAPPTRDHGLVVVDARTRHAPEVDEAGQVAEQEVVALARGEHPADRPARVAGQAHQHRQAGPGGSAVPVGAPIAAPRSR